MSYDEELILRTGQSSKEINYADGWLDVNEPQVVFFQGKRKSGKGVAIANCIEEMYKAGFTILHLWAARNNENWYYALTKHCKATWDEWRRRNNLKPIEEQKEEPLHCNCEKAIPISAMVPKLIYPLVKLFLQFQSNQTKNKVFQLQFVTPFFLQHLLHLPRQFYIFHCLHQKSLC